MQFICYPRCSTCQKAKKWLEANGISFEERHIKEQNPTAEELSEWLRKSGLLLKATSKNYFLRFWTRDFVPTKVLESPECCMHCGLFNAHC